MKYAVIVDNDHMELFNTAEEANWYADGYDYRKIFRKNLNGSGYEAIDMSGLWADMSHEKSPYTIIKNYAEGEREAWMVYCVTPSKHSLSELFDSYYWYVTCENDILEEVAQKAGVPVYEVEELLKKILREIIIEHKDELTN